MTTKNRNNYLRGAAIVAIGAALYFASVNRGEAGLAKAGIEPASSAPASDKGTPSGSKDSVGAGRRAMPGIAASDLEKKTWKLEDKRGKVVFINYWATWCPPCRIEMPDLVTVANRYRGRDVEFVGISLDTGGKDEVHQFVREQKIPYPIIMGADTPELARDIQAIPTSLLLDRHGRIAKTYAGMVSESVLSADIATLLTEE